MAPNKFIELEAGVDSRFKVLWLLVAVLSVLAIFIANTSWPIKLMTLGALALFCCFSGWQMHHRNGIRRLRIYRNGTVTLISRSGLEFPGILESDSWTSRWISVVPVGRFDHWRTQRLLVCASRNHATDYRQLLKSLRLGAAKHAGDGILGSG